MEFTYDITRTWDENCELGPRLTDPPPAVPVTPLKSFLTLPVSSRIGIAAGLLPNSRWILPYAQRGFDILTYKTVRSQPRACYPLPNWVFIEDPHPPHGPVFVTDNLPEDPADISSAVCFGMPSLAPDFWRNDIKQTRSGLGTGQLLIVSVVATPDADPRLDAIADDFALCAAWAVEAGAHIIEANLSCPNVCSAEGTLYQDAKASRIVTERIRSAIGQTPLLLKVGTFPDQTTQHGFLNVVDGLANGITLVNCISRSVLRRDGLPAFGPQYTTAGILGRAIHRPSVEAVRAMKECILKDNLHLQIAAVGGVSTVNDFKDFFDAGADAVLCGSSPMYLPNLAIEARRAHPEW